MKNIAPGLSLKKYKGNKHEQGGIMVNALGNKTKDITKAVAEVEGGEYNYRYNPNNPKDNYILSEQLGIANLAKQADKYKGNDRISYNTRNNLLNKSVKLNEILKAQQEQSQMQQAALGGMLKKYNPGGFLLKGSQSIVDSMVANSKQNDLTQVTTAPEIKLGKTTTPKLETKQAELPKLPVTTPKTTAEAANTGIQVNTKTNTTPEPTINKKGVKDVTSGLSGIASAFGPIGQAVGAGIQLAPYAVDLGKAMFDKTAVQDLQTQGSAMRLPNTKYAKHGGKLNVTPLPKFILGGDPNKLSKKENKKIQDRWDNLATNGNPDITEFEKLLGLSVSDKNIEPTTVTNNIPVTTPTTNNVTNTKPLKIKTKLEIDKKALAGDKSYLDNKSTTQNYIDYYQEKADEISRTNAGVTNKMYRSLSKFFNTPADFDPYFKSNPLNVKPINNVSNRLNSYPVSTPGNEMLYQPTTVTNNTPIVTNSTTQKIGDYSFDTTKLMPLTDLKAKLDKGEITEKDMVYITEDDRAVIKNPDGTYKFKETTMDEDSDNRIRNAFKTGINTLTTLPTTIKSIKPGVNNLTTLDVKKEMNIAKRAGLNVKPQPSESDSSKLYKAGQNKQKLSEALMYGMAALPSEQIKTITPDYGRGDDAMSRMGVSTEPIRQEIMQGANKALELNRSQVGTAGQLQSRGQSIMSNVGSQLAQSQLQQQQYLNQLRGALAQREDTKANVLAQSELTAREAKSAERAAKLDQLNNAISQTSAIGAGTMEQASKMSTIENENERFKRQQDFIRSLANQGVSFKVDENGNIVFDNKTSSSNIKPVDLSNPNKSVVKDDSVVQVTPKEHVVKQGEGLNAIAAQYKIPVDKLLKLNNLKIGDTIHPNQKLKIE